jgi:hypothetical protein
MLNEWCKMRGYYHTGEYRSGLCGLPNHSRIRRCLKMLCYSCGAVVTRKEFEKEDCCPYCGSKKVKELGGC